MTRKKRGCLILLSLVLLLVIAAAIALVFFLPGDVRFGAARPAAAPVSVSATTPGVSPAPGGSPAAAPALAPVQPRGGWMTYLVPKDILQSELSKAFPIRQNVVDLVKLQLDRPVFLDDPDGSFLRLRLDIQARVLEGNQQLPGSAVVRTQLSYDPAARAVKLRNAQLVELKFAGDAAKAAAALQPVLAAALAADMEGYVIFEVPADGLWWLKTGVAFVRDVYVSDGRVAIALGP